MLQIELINRRIKPSTKHISTMQIDRVVVRETIKADAYMPTVRYDEDNDGVVDVAMKIGNTREQDIIKNNDVIDCGTF